MALVLSGGHALGAFQAGAIDAFEAGGGDFDRVLGTSIGAINGAIFCGNEPELRTARLRPFWTEASGPTGRALERCRCRKPLWESWRACTASSSVVRRSSVPIGC